MKSIIFAIAILVTSVANGQITRSLPQVIQNLSNENYVIWAGWQNRQAARRAEEILADTAWNKFNYVKQLTSNSFSRGSSLTQTGSNSRSATLSGRGWSDSSGSRNGYESTNFNSRDGTVITSRQVRYRNPDYVGAGTVMTYNPWVRLRSGIGSPDWDNLFVPCEDGTLTMQEALNQLGPRNPEQVFKIFMGGYFGD
jgi:hypothetical protein